MSDDGRITRRSMRGESEDAVERGVGDESTATPKNDSPKYFTFTLAEDKIFPEWNDEMLLPVGQSFNFDPEILAQHGLIPLPSHSMASTPQVPTLPFSISPTAQQPLQTSSGLGDQHSANVQTQMEERISKWNQSLSMFDPKPPYPERPTTGPQQLLGHHLFGSQPQQGDGQNQALDPVTNILHVVQRPYDNPTMNNMGGHNYGTGNCLGLQHSTNLRQSITDGSEIDGQLRMDAAKIEAAIPLSQQKHGDTTGKEKINDIRRNKDFLASELPMPSRGFTAPEMEMDEELEELQKLVDAGIMEKDAPLYLAALKKRFNSQQHLPANLKHATEWKIVSERDSDHRYAVRNGEVPPADSINVYNMGSIRQIARGGGETTDRLVTEMKETQNTEVKAAGDLAYKKALAKSTKEIQEGPDCDCQKEKGAWKFV